MNSPAKWDARVVRNAFLQHHKDDFSLLPGFGVGVKNGGRDSLIIGCYLINGVESMLTQDAGLLAFGKVNFRGRQMTFNDPLA